MKHTLPMRVFSVLLCVAMLCTFAPLTSVAKTATPDVFVGGVQVTTQNAADILGDGTASFDKAEKTLTLKTSAIYDAYETEDGAAYGIYADGDLTVVIDGQVSIDLIGCVGKAHAAAIEATGDLTVTGCGSLSCVTPATASFSAGLVAGGSLVVNLAGQNLSVYDPVSDAVTLATGKAPQSYAVYGKDVTLVLAAVNFRMQAYTRLCNVTPTLKNVEAVEAVASLDAANTNIQGYEGEEILDVFDDAFTLSAFSCTVPPIEVAGTWLTVSNANDVLGDGTVSFDLKARELVLNNATITEFCGDYAIGSPSGPLGDIAAIYTESDITIRLIGDNVIDLRDCDYTQIPLYNQGIYVSDGDLTLVGSGNLSVYGGPSQDAGCGSYGAYLDTVDFQGNGDIAFYGDLENADASYGVYCNALTVSPSRYEEGKAHGLRFVGETAAIERGSYYEDMLKFTVFGSHDILCAQTTDAEDLAAADEEDNTLFSAKHVFLSSAELVEYELWVGGVQVTSNNYTDVLGDGSVSFEEYYDDDDDEWYRFLTLDNATITDAYRFDDVDFEGKSHFAYEGIYSCINNFTLYLEGDNVIDLTNLDADDAGYIDGIYGTGGDLTLTGHGSLAITLPDIVTEETTGISQNTVVIDEDVTLTIIAPKIDDAVGIFAYYSCSIYSPNVFVTAGDQAINVTSGSGRPYVDPDCADICTGLDYNDANPKKNTNILSDDGFPYYRTIKTSAPTYDLWVGGVQVTQENAYNFPCAGGDVYYIDSYNELTLDNAVINAGFIPFSEEMTMCGGIFSPVDDLIICLQGDNVINVASDDADGIIGIFAGNNLAVYGDGSLTINLQGKDAEREAVGIFINNNAEFDNNGTITVTVTGNESVAGGIIGYNLGIYNRGGLNVNVQGKEAVGLISYADTEFNTAGAVNVTATSTSSTTKGDALRVFDELFIAEGNGTCSFAGSVVAINPDFLVSADHSTLKMTAYTDQAGENEAESPLMDNLASYKKVMFTQPYSVTPILTKTEAECPVEVSYGVFEGENEAAEISWEVEGTPKYIHVLCDADNDGSFRYYLESADYELVTSFSRVAYTGVLGDIDLTCLPCQWRLCAEYADGTLAYSDPFTVTYYQMLRNYDLAVYPTLPSIGSTPESNPGAINHDLYYSCKELPVYTWYRFDGDIAYEMASDEVFLPGERYAVSVESPLMDTVRIDSDTFMAHLEEVDGLLDYAYDPDGNRLLLTVEFEPLKTQLRALMVSYNNVDETTTPADATYSALGSEYSPFCTLPVAGGAIEAVWSYCEGDTYTPTNAKTLGNSQAFAADRSYHLTLTVPLADRFKMANDPHYECSGMYDSLTATYDPDENVVTFDILIGYIERVVTALDLTVFEPEAGMQAGNTFPSSGATYANITATTWYELDGDGNVVKTLEERDQFEAGKTYLVQLDVALASGAFFPSPYITITVNGNEAYSDDTYVSAPTDADAATVYAVFTAPTTPTVEIDTIDFTVSPFTANDTLADVAVGFDDTLVSAIQTAAIEYLGKEEPKTFNDVFSAAKILDENDRLEYGKTYAIRISYTLKAGVTQDASAVTLNINGEKAKLTYPVDIKRGALLALVTLDEPTITLSADTTEFERFDEALEAASFDVAFDFEPTNAAVTVYDADDDEVVSAEVDAAKDSFTVDLSSLEVGTYTVVVTANDGKNTVASNRVDVVVKMPVIDEINIQNADITPVYGEKAGDHMAFTLPENAPYTVAFNGWWDVFNSRILDANDTFEANCVYSACWNLVANEGYVFADDATILINGSADALAAEYSYLDVSGEEPLFIISANGVFVEEPTKPTSTETEPTATATETEPTATATEPTATATGTQADEILYGDANGDGEVNMKDVLTLRKHLAGIEIMLHPLNSDANGDGEINMKDVLMIRKYMANLITELGPTA